MAIFCTLKIQQRPPQRVAEDRAGEQRHVRVRHHVQHYCPRNHSTDDPASEVEGGHLQVPREGALPFARLPYMCPVCFLIGLLIVLLHGRCVARA